MRSRSRRAARRADEETSAGAGSAQPQGTKVRITLGTQGFPEALILGELWQQALAANGYAVVLRKNIGPAGDLDQALRDGEIDGHVAYTGTVLSVVARRGRDGPRPGGDLPPREGVLRRARHGHERHDAVRERRRHRHHEHASRRRSGCRRSATCAGLDSFTLGARPEFESLFLGLEGLQEVYDLTNAEFKPIALGAQYTALDEGDVDAANVFTTDAELADGDYELLEDPEKLFGSQNVVMVVDDGKLERIGRDNFLRVVDEVNARLTDDAILEMNAAVSGGQDEADVARRFLRDAGLLRGS